MNKVMTSGKAIWRKPNEQIFYTIASGVGDDEFLIAPFIKSENIFKINGRITKANTDNIDSFFLDMNLRKSASQHSTLETHYTDTVQKAVEAIKHDRFEKVVIARQLFHEGAINISLLYQQLAAHYPSAFVYCFYLENGQCMIGATPETLLRGSDKELYTEALGGTNQSYGFSSKEYKEHEQIITDISNKLKQLSYDYKTGETAQKNAGNVTHLATPITITGKNESSDNILLNLLHPTSAVCGLPFVDALQFILSNEDFQRHFYTGYLGIKTQESFAYFVNLRCAEIFSDGACLYAGAGINRDSIASDEWTETNEKIATLLHFFKTN
ncbi:MAG: chorismate-binding protein [Bacteroidota bacterium]